MMKKFLVILLSATMMFSLMACGSSEPEYTDEQLACIEVYEEMFANGLVVGFTLGGEE